MHGDANPATIVPAEILEPEHEEKKVGFKIDETALISRRKGASLPDGYLDTHLVKAHSMSKFKAIPPRVNDGTYTIVFDLHEIEIKDHPLMTQEQRISKECLDMINVLKERQRSGIVDFLDKKLTALKSAHMEFKLNNASIARAAEPEIDDGVYPAKPAASFYERRGQTLQDEIIKEEMLKAEQNRDFLTDIRATRMLRDTEMQTNLILEFEILKKWESIKNIRNQQGFVSSNLKILVKTSEGNHEQVSCPPFASTFRAIIGYANL